MVEDFSGHDNAGEPLVMSPVATSDDLDRSREEKAIVRQHFDEIPDGTAP